MVQNLDYYTGEQKLQDILFSRPNVRSITGTVIEDFLREDEVFYGLRLVKSETGERSEVYCDGLFVAIGLIPENDAFANVAKLNGYGYIDSGEDCLTKTPGIFCAGDCRSKTVRQLTTAAADGAVAAIAACNYIDAM